MAMELAEECSSYDTISVRNHDSTKAQFIRIDIVLLLSDKIYASLGLFSNINEKIVAA